MSVQKQSFEKRLEEKPSLHELCEHIVIGGKWYQLGIQLKLDATKLDFIDEQPRDYNYKTTKMFQLLLTTSPQVTRKQILEALKKRVLGEISVADEYEEKLRNVSCTFAGTDSLATEPSTIFQSHVDTLLYSLINPIKISQLLFSEKCISETTLDDMETSEISLDEKWTALLSAIHTAVSLDHKMLKVLARVLSKFEETKHLSDNLIREYDQTFYNDQMTTFNIQGKTLRGCCDLTNTNYEDYTSELSLRKRKRETEGILEEESKRRKEKHGLEQWSDFNEKYKSRVANDTLRCHYGTLSECLQYPVRVAQQLYEERVIPRITLSVVKQSSSEDVALFVLLKAVRHAVHTNYRNLIVFAGILLKFKSSVICANAILKDCDELLSDGDIPEVQPSSTRSNEGNDNPPTTPSKVSVESSSSGQDVIAKEYLIPRKLDTILGSMRRKFAVAFSKVREAINENSPPLDKLMRFLTDGYSHLKSQISHASSIDDVLDIVRDHCSLINISCLESIVERFEIKEAEIHIKEYKDAIQSFCRETKACLCLDESFEVTKSPLLRCETAIYVLNWDPKVCTIEDVKDVLAVSVEGNVEIRDIREGKSIIVTCYFPRSLLGILIAKAQETLELVKKKGLIRLTIGQCVIYDSQKRDEEVRAIIEEKETLRNQLEIQQSIIRSKTMELTKIQDTEKKLLLETAKRQREVEELQQVVTSMTFQLRERDKQNEELKQSLKNIALMQKPLSDQGIQETQIKSSQEEISLTIEPSLPEMKDPLKDLADDEKSDSGNITWSDDDYRVDLVSPTVKQCKDVVSMLIKKQQKEKEWSVWLYRSSPESTLEIISNLNECAVWEIRIVGTPLDSNCVSTLSEIIATNRTLKRLWLHSSPLTGDIKPVSDALLTNTTLEVFGTWDATITDEDATNLSDMLSINKILKVLNLSNCKITDNGIQCICEGLTKNQTLKVLHLDNSNITDNGVEYICNGLTKNQTLTTLDISRNPQITSVSTNTIVELINATSLEKLRLNGTSLKYDNVETICTALSNNSTIQTLYLPEQFKKHCKGFDSFNLVKDRVEFWPSSSSPEY